ncbi:MAG: enoyl-CoA hydratase-related protein [Fimbriiglobus sp.]|nr:enoyl-CoA hydratase-related protein [Fimbriiglobus sp.]
MLYESTHVRISTNDGIGTLWLSPPSGRIGEPFLRQLLPALEVVANTAGIEILVLRSGTPVGFGRGLESGSLHDGLPKLGQRVTASLATLPFPTVALVEGPCLGPGLELVLACDWRLAVAGPDSWVGFGGLPPGWGGRTRLRQMGRRVSEQMTAREAVRAGVFDHAFCERRGKIELRTWLDRLQFAPRKRSASWWGWFVDVERGYAGERRAFRAALQEGMTATDPQPIPRPLNSVGLTGTTTGAQSLAAELTMRGVRVVWVNGPEPKAIFGQLTRRGRLTPLEADQAATRIRTASDADALTECDWVLLDDAHSDLAGMLERDLLPRAILSVPAAHLERATLLVSRPQRVTGIRFRGNSAELAGTLDTDPETTAAVAGWLGVAGVVTTLAEPLAVVPAAV